MKCNLIEPDNEACRFSIDCNGSWLLGTFYLLLAGGLVWKKNVLKRIIFGNPSVSFMIERVKNLFQIDFKTKATRNKIVSHFAFSAKFSRMARKLLLISFAL